MTAPASLIAPDLIVGVAALARFIYGSDAEPCQLALGGFQRSFMRRIFRMADHGAVSSKFQPRASIWD